jgi:TPR repeat protein
MDKVVKYVLVHDQYIHSFSHQQCRLALLIGNLHKQRAFIYWLTKMAEKNHAPAQAILGDAFFHGNKTYKDYDRAYHWLVRAAEQNQADTQLTLGLIHSEGMGREKDTKKAIIWWQKIKPNWSGGICLQ